MKVLFIIGATMATIGQAMKLIMKLKLAIAYRTARKTCKKEDRWMY